MADDAGVEIYSIIGVLTLCVMLVGIGVGVVQWRAYSETPRVSKAQPAPEDDSILQDDKAGPEETTGDAGTKAEDDDDAPPTPPKDAPDDKKKAGDADDGAGFGDL